MSTSHLNTLHSRLAALRRRRWLLRTGTAVAALALAVLWTLCGMFVLDWLVEFDKPQRVVLVLAGLGSIYWAWSQFCQPYLGQDESELDMALLVERQQHIDSDLVAALQFESPQASYWGSSSLETAVIDYVAEFSKDLNVFAGLSTRPFARRAVLTAMTLAVIAALSTAFPGHLSAFLNRMSLGSQHYPTRTVIEQIVLNNKPRGDALIKSPYWEPLRFEVHASGELPAEGEAELRSKGGVRTTVKLLADSARSGVYLGQLDRLVDSVAYQLYLGDAWTDPADVLVIPLPVVDLDLRVTPPAYTALSEKETESQPGARQVSVVEGSHVAVHLASDKRLKSSALSIGAQKYPLVRHTASSGKAAGNGHDHWKLDQPDTPLSQVAEPLKYELQVEDVDGLRLKDPIQGFIRIKADRQPRVSAAVITQHVLPAAKPSITYGAADDYGVALLRLHRQAVRGDDKIVDDTIEVPVGPDSQPSGPQKIVRGRLPVDLGLLKLAKGDQLKLTFEAIDYRGSLPGKSALSEPLVLHVTDERGVLAAMVEADERSARQLDAIIQRQLGIGDSP